MVKDKKKLLFVISYLHIGGAERALAEITRNFSSEWEIDILLNGNQPIDFEYRGNLLFLGIDENPQMASVFFHAKILYRRLLALWKLKRSGKYTACISFLDSANVANILTKSPKCKTIISIRTSLKKKTKLPQYKYIVNPLAKILYNKADWIVAVSQGVGRELVEQFGLLKEKVVVIENGYDIKRMEELGKEELIHKEAVFIKNKKVIVTLGRLTDAKGQWHLIRAFSRIATEVENVVLVIVGGGELEEYLKNVAEEFEISNKILFTGYSNNPYKYLTKSDIFVLSSLYEGFPNALAEAICLGLPCIATDICAGAYELLAPMTLEKQGFVKLVTNMEYGIITPCCSGNRLMRESLEMEELELSKAICNLLQDDKLRFHYSQKSRERRAELGIDSVIKKYEAIIVR